MMQSISNLTLRGSPANISRHLTTQSIVMAGSRDSMTRNQRYIP